MSSSNEKIEFNRSRHKEYRLPCSNCDNKTSHEVLLSVNLSGKQDEADIQYWEDYEIIQCQGCKEVSFRKNNKNTEDIFIVPIGNKREEVLADHEELYPSRIVGQKQIQKIHLAPYEVRRIYEETYKAMINNLPILTAIGIRALIEAICKEKETTGNNLQEKIDELMNLGILTPDATDILHSIRLLGNEAAHEVEPPKADILNIVFEIVENLLQSVYILPQIASKLKK